jgi:hypothetical protein
MKKIIFMLIVATYSVALVAQTDSLSLDEYGMQVQSLNNSINESFKKKDYKTGEKLVNEAIALFARLPKEKQKNNKGWQAGHYYNLACVYSLQNQKKKAVDAFEKSVKEYEYVNYSHAKTDTDLDNIRTDKRFIALMQSIREKGDYLYILQQAGKYQATDTAGLPHFDYERMENARLQDVRNYFKIDSIAGQGDEISKILNLLAWVHNNIRHDGSNYALCEFDAIDIYHYYKATGKGANCRHLAIALNEMYLSMGFKSRFIVCMPKSETDQDCHIINSVYSETLKKWLWIDPTFNAYVKDENGNLLGIAEVRQRLIDNRPLVLNEDANWNNENKQTKEYYLDSYMAKNLYWLQCPVNSHFNVESRYRNSTQTYISLKPLGYQHSDSWRKEVITNDPDYFWQAPLQP